MSVFLSVSGSVSDSDSYPMLPIFCFQWFWLDPDTYYLIRIRISNFYYRSRLMRHILRIRSGTAILVVTIVEDCVVDLNTMIRIQLAIGLIRRGPHDKKKFNFLTRDRTRHFILQSGLGPGETIGPTWR